MRAAKVLTLTFTTGAAMTACLVSGCSSQPGSAAGPADSASAQSVSSQDSAAPAVTSSASAAQASPSPSRSSAPTSPARAAGVPRGVPMPNRSLTPGAIQSSDTSAICTPGWAEAHRDVSYATEDEVAREYGLSSHYGYEIDHLIPLELGGSNSTSNLWPEPYNSAYGANQK